MREQGILRRSLRTRELWPKRPNRGLPVSSVPGGREVHVGSLDEASRSRFHAEALCRRQMGRCAHREKCGPLVQLASRPARERHPHQPEHRCGRPPSKPVTPASRTCRPTSWNRVKIVLLEDHSGTFIRKGLTQSRGRTTFLTNAALLGADAHVEHCPSQGSTAIRRCTCKR